jgi:3-oxoacyl-[acyl-carrier-protein] synthase II
VRPAPARRRTVVTGIGLVTSLGHDVETFWSSLVAGLSGVSTIERFDASGYPTRIAAEIKDFDPDELIEPKDSRLMGRFTQFAVAASARALEDAGLEVPRDADPERVGVMIGSGGGGYAVIEDEALHLHQDGLKAVSPYFGSMMLAGIPAGMVAIRCGARGATAGIATACAAGAHAIADGCRLIERGDADVMICGGTEAPIFPLGLAGFSAMHALSRCNDEPERACRPFDRSRDGFVMAEGSGVVVLEELEHAAARGAAIYAEVAGCAATTDGYNMAAPRPDGRWAARCMQLALEDAGMEPADIDYINAHATATKVGDAGETKAIKVAFGDHAHRLACGSTKSMTGHLLGAAGAVEAVICALSVQRDVIPPTINLHEPDPQCDLDYVPGEARATVVRAAMSNSFGFGGHNATLILKKVTP